MRYILTVSEFNEVVYDDELAGGPGDGHRPRPWVRVMAAGVLVAAAASVIVVRSSGGPSRPPTAAATPSAPLSAASSVAPVRSTQGFLLTSLPAVSVAAVVVVAPGWGPLERRDDGAATGPWTVTVRRSDGGSLGYRSAVVTYPVPAPGVSAVGSESVRVGTVQGTLVPSGLVWPVDGGYARVRGDIASGELAAVATGTRIQGGHPKVNPPVGYTVVATGPYRAPVIREIRSGSASLGGLLYTGVTRGGGFEDALFQVAPSSGGTVEGHRAVVSPVQGGNATLAWELAPGVVAYVGYSGGPLTTGVVAILHDLAVHAHGLTTAQWQASHPQIESQLNDFGGAG